MFCPERTLHTSVILALSSGKTIGRSFGIVGSSQIVGPIARTAGLIWSFALLTVDIIRAVESHDIVKFHIGSLNGRSRSGMPAHNSDLGSFDAIELRIFGCDGFIPHRCFMSVLLDEIGHLLDETTLQPTIALEPLTLIQSLALGILLPSVGGTFIATNRNHLEGEEVHHFFHNVLGELNSFGIGHVENVRINTTLERNLVFSIGPAAKFGIGRQCRNNMTGHIDFRKDFYMACFGISHHLAHLFLRVEERPILLIGPIRAVLQISEIGVFTRGTNSGEFGIFLDFQTPTLVVRDVPVEAIELIVGHHVEYFLNLINIEEMTRNVEHKTTIAKARTIRDADNGEGQSCQTGIGHTCTNRGGH